MLPVHHCDISYHNHNKTPLCFTNGILTNLNFYFAFQKGLLQHRYIPTVSANIIARERIRILHGDGANHRQKEKMIRLFILTASIIFAVVGIYYRSNPSTRFIINSVHIIYCDDLIQMFVPKCQLRFSEA